MLEKNMEKTAFLTVQASVETQNVDFLGLWRPSRMLEHLIDTASRHAAILGYSYEDLVQQRIVWVLSRLNVHFYRRPGIGEQVSTRTWIKGIQQKLFFLRDFEMKDKAGEKVLAASFAWLLIDTGSRRILPASSMKVTLPDPEGQNALTETLEKLNAPEGMPEAFVAPVTYGIVDILGHATSARYVDWIFDCFPLETYREKQVSQLRLNFVREILPGEQVSIRAARQDGAIPETWMIAGENLSTGERAFEAALSWKEISA
jgi:medium-chain acyl-[acyl-carrier-protein] hydrolase